MEEEEKKEEEEEEKEKEEKDQKEEEEVETSDCNQSSLPESCATTVSASSSLYSLPQPVPHSGCIQYIYMLYTALDRGPLCPRCVCSGGWFWLRCCYFLVHRLLTVADEPIVPNGMSNCLLHRMFTSFQMTI